MQRATQTFKGRRHLTGAEISIHSLGDTDLNEQKGLSMNIKDEFMTVQAEQPQATTAKQAQDKAQENKTSTTIRLTIEAPEWDFILGIVKKLLDAYPELEYSLGKISGNEAFFEIDVFDDDDLKAYTTELNQWFKETGIKGTVDTRIITFYE